MGPFEHFAHFYVEMPFNLPTPTNNQQDENSNPKLNDPTIPSQTYGVAKLG
jgi:hypothetical protein